MADETTPTTDNEGSEVDEGQEPPTDESGPEGEGSTEEQAGDEPSEEKASEDGDKPELTLDDAKAALAKVRKSEAATRVRLREAQEQLENAKTPEEVQAIVDKMKADSEAEAFALVKENVALKFKIPDDLAATLAGSTREELEAHAKVLAKYLPKEPSNDPELSGGLTPVDDGEDSTFDPVAAARKARQRSY